MKDEQTKNPESLPESDDPYWEGAAVQRHTPVPVHICSHHTKDAFTHGTYVDNRDGTISCTVCPWGTKLGSTYRVYQGKVIDLRSL